VEYEILEEVVVDKNSAGLIQSLQSQVKSLEKEKRALEKHIGSLVVKLSNVTEDNEVLKKACKDKTNLEYTEVNQIRTFINYGASLSSQNIEELDNISPSVKKDSFYVARIMSMIFTKQELADSSVLGKTSQNPKNVQVTDIALSELKKKFVEKMFSLHISKDFANLGWHETRLKKINQLMNSKIQNSRKMKKRSSTTKT
jgi:hypothetical protein